MDCYKNFAHIYDELINSDIDYHEWSKVILNICDEFNIDKAHYLDLCCGTGNLTQQLAQYFNDVWAVDLSYDMLTEADVKLRKSGFKIKMVCQDMTQLNLNKKFDLITCCLDSTNYILEKEKILEYFKKVGAHLQDSGIFVFDMNSYYKLTNIIGNNIFDYDNENVTYIWENYIEEDIVNMYLIFFVKDGQQLYRKFTEEHRERAYRNDEICSLLKKAGFRILKIMDNYEKNFINDLTERIVYVVKIDN